jgi:hypothetical protein
MERIVVVKVVHLLKVSGPVHSQLRSQFAVSVVLAGSQSDSKSKEGRAEFADYETGMNKTGLGVKGSLAFRRRKYLQKCQRDGRRPRWRLQVLMRKKYVWFAVQTTTMLAAISEVPIKS